MLRSVMLKPPSDAIEPILFVGYTTRSGVTVVRLCRQYYRRHTSNIKRNKNVFTRAAEPTYLSFRDGHTCRGQIPQRFAIFKRQSSFIVVDGSF